MLITPRSTAKEQRRKLFLLQVKVENKEKSEVCKIALSHGAVYHHSDSPCKWCSKTAWGDSGDKEVNQQ